MFVNAPMIQDFLVWDNVFQKKNLSRPDAKHVFVNIFNYEMSLKFDLIITMSLADEGGNLFLVGGEFRLK